MKKFLTEDEVREGYVDDNHSFKGAKQLLGFDSAETNVTQGTGQLTTFKQLGFNCESNNNRPDGWYLPKNLNSVAIILETKASNVDIDQDDPKNELLKNIKITNIKYSYVVGILYNGKKHRVFLNNDEYGNPPRYLQNKSFYLSLFNNDTLDTQKIFLTTMRINNLLHYKFGVNDYYDRMIFTACALVAKRYGAWLDKGRDYTTLHNSILNTLSKSLEKAVNQNSKLKLLLEKFSSIQMSITDNQDAIDSFIESIENISELINSSSWNGEDVMGIFFNEFNRYKGKSENGQVFTPEHITSFMCKLIEINKDDKVLDAACGSGAFLTKAMAYMTSEVGGMNTNEASTIMSSQIFGIEKDPRVFSLACANMLIHRDGKTNLEQMDTTSDEACKWIKDKIINKVLMNPPYERKSHPEIIIKNVLDNCSKNTKAAILLPDKKIEKLSAKWRKEIFSNHRLLKIIKLPEKLFDEGVTVSIFIFETGVPQKNEEIFTCYIEDDGLERVKNQGRQDVKNKWPELEKHWLEIIKKQSGDKTIKWINPNINQSYQIDFKPFEIKREDFLKQQIDYILYKEGLNSNNFFNNLASKILYSCDISIDKLKNIGESKINRFDVLNIDSWKQFNVGKIKVGRKWKGEGLFNIYNSTPYHEKDVLRDETNSGLNYVVRSKYNNGIKYKVEKVDSFKINPAKTISFGAENRDFFYQSEEYITGNKMYYIDTSNIDERASLFFINVLQKTFNERYSFADGMIPKQIYNKTILLPQDSEGNVDWNYMSNYISQIQLEAKTRINSIKSFLGFSNTKV